MIRPEHQCYIRPDLRKAASTKAESTTAESAIRPKQLVRLKTGLNSERETVPVPLVAPVHGCTLKYKPRNMS
jgi:hypothetical protein